MAHVAIQEADADGQVVTWGDHVTDTEYAGTAGDQPAGPYTGQTVTKEAQTCVEW